jgi:hypothetical protein
MSKEMTYQGRTVDVVEVNGGWTTILDGMKQIKVRNGELSKVKPKESPLPERPGKLLSSARKEREQKQTPKPKREPKPKSDDADDSRLVKPNLDRYVTSAEVKTASGRKAIDINDEVATRLRGLDLADTYREAASVTGQTQKSLREKYEHLNPGMQRMNLGNLIRGAASKAAREAEKASQTK